MLSSVKKQDLRPKYFKWARTMSAWRHIWVMEALLPFTEFETWRRPQYMLSSICAWEQIQRHCGTAMQRSVHILV